VSSALAGTVAWTASLALRRQSAHGRPGCSKRTRLLVKRMMKIGQRRNCQESGQFTSEKMAAYQWIQQGCQSRDSQNRR
jgi:hypothetical protein